MLTTLTCISGLYCGFGHAMNLTNKYMVKLNMIYTWPGKQYLIQPKIIKEGMMYKVSQQGIRFDNDGETYLKYHWSKSNYTFTMEHCPTTMSTIVLNNPEVEIVNKDKALDVHVINESHLKSIYNEYKNQNIMIEYKLVKNGDVWYLADEINNVSMMTNMNKEQFRKHVLEKYKIRFTFIVSCLFYFLLFACYIRYLTKGDSGNLDDVY